VVRYPNTPPVIQLLRDGSCSSRVADSDSIVGGRKVSLSVAVFSESVADIWAENSNLTQGEKL